jgi:hypothetical protein
MEWKSSARPRAVVLVCGHLLFPRLMLISIEPHGYTEVDDRQPAWQETLLDNAASIPVHTRPQAQ